MGDLEFPSPPNPPILLEILSETDGSVTNLKLSADQQAEVDPVMA